MLEEITDSQEEMMENEEAIDSTTKALGADFTGAQVGLEALIDTKVPVIIELQHRIRTLGVPAGLTETNRTLLT